MFFILDFSYKYCINRLVISDTDKANTYYLLPADPVSAPVIVGGAAVMNEVEALLLPDQIIATTGDANSNGTPGEKCMVIVKLSKNQCEEFINLGRNALDELLYEAHK